MALSEDRSEGTEELLGGVQASLHLQIRSRWNWAVSQHLE